MGRFTDLKIRFCRIEFKKSILNIFFFNCRGAKYETVFDPVGQFYRQQFGRRVVSAHLQARKSDTTVVRKRCHLFGSPCWKHIFLSAVGVLLTLHWNKYP